MNLLKAVTRSQQPQEGERQRIKHVVTFGKRLGDPDDVLSVHGRRLLAHSPQKRQLLDGLRVGLSNCP